MSETGPNNGAPFNQDQNTGGPRPESGEAQQPPAAAHGSWAAPGAPPPGGAPGAATGGGTVPGGGAEGPPPFPPDPAAGAPAPPPGSERESFWKRNRVPLVAGVTALVTSLIVGPAAALGAVAFLGGEQNQSQSSLSDNQASNVSSGDVSKVAESVRPSVVSIEAGEGAGSGVVISSDGQILTNNHVVAQSDGDTVKVQFNDGDTAKAKVLGKDPVSDLAVLNAQGQQDLTPAVFGDSDKVEVGADVVAIGSPLGLSGTVTSGVVSAKDRPVNTGVVEGDQGQDRPDSPFDLPGGGEDSPQARTSTVINAIQTDTPINPGNSGGPLVNMNGEVVGLNTAIAGTGGGLSSEAGSIGLGFAIPINQAKPIAEQLIDTGTATYAAVEATIAPNRDGAGARVVEVNDGGAADQAGLEGDDIITSVNGNEVDGPDALIAAIRSHQPDDTITVGYQRDGDQEETEVTLSAQSADSING